MTPYVCTGGEAAYPVELIDQNDRVVTGILSSACHAEWLVLNYREFSLFPNVERMTWRYRSDAQLNADAPEEPADDEPGAGPVDAGATGQ